MSELRKIALGFRNGLLGKKPSNWMCIAVCAPLQSFLAVVGYETQLIDGCVLDEDGDVMHHCWLGLPDGRILDPTADQFSTPTRRMPKVYIGKLPTWYAVE